MSPLHTSKSIWTKMPKILKGGYGARAEGRLPRRNPSVCLSPQAWRPREQTALGWAGARPSAPQPEGTSPHHAAACLFFLFFLQHVPRGPAPPMAPSGQLLGAGLSPSGSPPHTGPWKAARHALPRPLAPVLALSPPGPCWPVHGSHCAFCENFATGLLGRLTEPGPGGSGTHRVD